MLPLWSYNVKPSNMSLLALLGSTAEIIVETTFTRNQQSDILEFISTVYMQRILGSIVIQVASSRLQVQPYAARDRTGK